MVMKVEKKLSRFVLGLPISDSKFIRKSLNNCEPRLDLQRQVTAPSGEKVDVRVTFGRSFFGLSSEYRVALLDEIYYLSKHVNFTYQNVMTMPTYERKYFINKLVEEFEKQREEIEKRNSKR